MQVGCFLAAALAIASVGRGRHFLPIAGTLGAVCGLAALGLVQSLPLPAALVGALSPHHAAVYASASELVGESLGASLSLAPGVSRSAAIHWLALGGALAAGVVLGRRRRQRRWVFGAILAGGAFQVIYGARGRVAGTDAIWGAIVEAGPGRLRGTFVNPDHLAVYLEICLAVAFGWWWWMMRRTRREEKVERRIALVGVPALAWFVLFVALAYTGSRAGLLAGVVGVATQCVLLAAVRRRWALAPIGVLVVLAGIAVVIAVGLQAGLGRWLATSGYELSQNERLDAYGATLELWSRYPIFGSGLGTFRDAFPAVQPAALTGTVWRHAHNAPLELLATTGLVGLALALFGLWWIVARLLRVLFATQRTEGRVAVIAAFGALVSVSIHELFDFGLTMPANSLTLALVLAMAAGVRIGKRT